MVTAAAGGASADGPHGRAPDERALGGRPALFLDRDGVLNVDTGYLVRPEAVRFVPGADAAVRYANRLDYKVFVVTNQSGVARGYYTEADVNALHAWMADRLSEAGARIDAFAYCPHHPEGTEPAYAVDCRCRKPKPGMIEDLVGAHGIDRTRSLLIGDRDSDLAAARAAGVAGHLFDADRLDLLVEALLAPARG
jgi:D-glycero-D-manno-heptose 1,7-bisphosphate phosphatase